MYTHEWICILIWAVRFLNFVHKWLVCSTHCTAHTNLWLWILIHKHNILCHGCYSNTVLTTLNDYSVVLEHMHINPPSPSVIHFLLLYTWSSTKNNKYSIEVNLVSQKTNKNKKNAQNHYFCTCNKGLKAKDAPAHC